MVAISLVEEQIWSILIFNVRRIALLQSVTIQFCRVFWHILYYKVRQSNFITKCGRLLLQSASGITKCDSCYKVRRNNVSLINFENERLNIMIYRSSLTLSWRRPLSYRNQTKPDWFLYDNGLRHERVKEFFDKNFELVIDKP